MKLRTHHTTCCFGLSIIVFLLFSMVACAPVAPETSDPAEQATATPTVEGDTPTPEPTEEETGLPEQPLPPPEICTPDAPRLSPIEEITSEPSEFDDSIFTINARYTNPEKDQQFQLKVSSQDPERADEFLGKLRVCFEAITTDMQAGLLTTDTDPETNRQLALSFLRETERNVLVEMEWLSGQERQEENLFVIYYLIDPTIDADGSDGYRAKCVKSARVRPDMRNGSGDVAATLFWKGGSVGTADANAAANPYPTAVSHSNGVTKTTYDARVDGSAGSIYLLEGSWTEDGSEVTQSLANCQ